MGFDQLKVALESIGFKPQAPVRKSVDDGDYDDTLEQHEMEERMRLLRG